MQYTVYFVICLNNSSTGGLYYAATERIKAFIKNNPDFNVEVFNLTSQIPKIIMFVKQLLGRTNELQNENIVINGLKCKNLYLTKTNLISYIRGLIFSNSSIEVKIEHPEYLAHNLFYKCDILSAHYGITSGDFAHKISRLLKKPFSVTYHGSDIHTQPFKSLENKILIEKILNDSAANIFVSAGLAKKALELSLTPSNSHVIYNGVDLNVFKRSETAKIDELKHKLNIQGKVVAFVGNLIDVKNVLTLPRIFYDVKEKYSGKLTFLIIGEGNLKTQMVNVSTSLNIQLLFTGKLRRETMPLYYSMIDVMVLPSKNEGLPLVLMEALACGVSCVGSHVGGISEVIGEDNTFELNSDFIENVSNKIIHYLTASYHSPLLNSGFNLTKNALLEGDVYREILNQSNQNK